MLFCVVFVQFVLTEPKLRHVYALAVPVHCAAAAVASCVCLVELGVMMHHHDDDDDSS